MRASCTVQLNLLDKGSLLHFVASVNVHRRATPEPRSDFHETSAAGGKDKLNFRLEHNIYMKFAQLRQRCCTF